MRAEQFGSLLPRVSEVNLLAKGAAAFLYNKRQPEYGKRTVEERHVPIPDEAVGTRHENGTRHGDAVARKRNVRERLVIAQGKRAHAVEHAKPLCLKLHAEVFILIPKDGKIIAGSVKQRQASRSVEKQRIVCARIKGDPLRLRSCAECIPQCKEIGFLNEAVNDQ